MPIHSILCEKMVNPYVSLLYSMTVPHEPVYSLLALYCGQLPPTEHSADDKLRLVLENEAARYRNKAQEEPF